MHAGGVGAGWSVKGEEQPRAARPIGVDFRGSAAEERVGPIGWATRGLRPLTGRAPAPTNSEALLNATPTTERAVNAIGSVLADGRPMEQGNDRSRSDLQRD